MDQGVLMEHERRDDAPKTNPAIAQQKKRKKTKRKFGKPKHWRQKSKRVTYQVEEKKELKIRLRKGMSDISKQQQAAVAAHHSSQQQQAAAQQHPQMQQQVDSQGIQVQLGPDGSDQMHSQGNQGIQNLQSPPSLPPMHSQAATITTMSTAPQQMGEWPGHGRVQVIQQPIQNPTTYIQPVYNAQGQLIVPGNIALHPGGMNQPIQVIAAGKPFQPGQMPHMLTAQGKPIVQSPATSFPGYATIPTSAGNQTLVISQLGVLGQPNLLPQQQNKPQEMQKMITKANVNTGSNATATTNQSANMKPTQPQQQSVSIGNLVNSQAQAITTQAQAIIQPQIISPIQYTCNTQQQRAVPQGAPQAMQFTPWQATFGPAGLPQGLTWAPGIQSSTLLTPGSQIFIRNPAQQEQAGMFIQNPQAPAMPQHNPMQGQQLNKNTQGIDVATNVQPKAAITKAFSTILPNSVGPQQMKSSTGVGTQTVAQTPGMHQPNLQAIKMGPKIRAKTVCRMPTMPPSQKADAANQTKPSVQLIQPKLVLSNIIPPQDSKMVKPGMQPPAQASQQPQPLTQIQQMQNIFPEPVEQKPQPGQLMMNNGVANAGQVVSMPSGQMGPLMGNMIVQTVPGLSSITIPSGQPVQDMMSGQAIPGGTTIKQEAPEQKEVRNIQENGISRESRGVDTNASSDDSLSEPEEKPAKIAMMVEEKEKDEEDKENKEVDKKGSEKDSSQKATMMVKPQVLTHVIEGFVIQESSEPFPVNRGCVDGIIRKIPTGDATENGEPPAKRQIIESKERETATCQFCGKKDLKSKFKKSKRFCSLSCARRDAERSNSGRAMEVTEPRAEIPPPTAEPTENQQAQSAASQENENRVNPLQWSVAEVCEFIRTLPGCAEYVEDFALQDIDGEALMLLKPDHLMSVMSMKLGPAVKIIAKIDTMRNGDQNPAA